MDIREQGISGGCCTTPGFLAPYVPAGGVGADNGTAALADLLRVLADPARLAILRALAERRCVPVRGVDLCNVTGLTPATISHHMARLVDAGFASSRRNGRTIHYELLPGRLATLSAALDPGPR